MANRQTRILQIPERTLIVPTNVPLGLQPLSLPDDFNETINNQFCLILQSNLADNYSLNVKGLNTYDMANMQDNESNIALVNATGKIEENTWYRITVVLSLNGITTTLQNMNGTLIQTKATPYDATGNKKLAILITNNIDNAVAFKDLKIQALNNTVQPTETQKPTSGSSGELALYLIMSVLLAIAGTTAIGLYVKKKKSSKTKNLPP
jgi:hypothetical protein